MKKKAVNAAFCLAVSLMLALAGCGSTAEEGAGGQTQVLDEREVEVQEEKEVVATGKITMEPEETEEAEQTAETEETKEAAGTEETEETEQAAAETAEETKQAAASQSTKTAQTKESTKASGSSTGSTAASKPAESQAASSSTGSTAASKPAESQAASGSGTGSTAASKPAESQAASGSSTGSTAASKPAEAHTHSFTSVKISDADCESGAVYEERCSCGATNGTHTEGSGLGHDYQYSGPYVAATCSGGGIDEDKCTRCGAIRWTNVPALPHSWTETLTYGGNCISPQEYTITCSVCGAPGGTRLGDYTDDHDWQTVSWQEADPVTMEYITVTKVKCSRCNAEQ